MIPDCKRRIKAAYNDLQTLVVSDYFPCSFCKNMSFFKVAYYSFVRFQEVYTTNVQI